MQHFAYDARHVMFVTLLEPAMSYPYEVLALALVVASLVGMLWAMFWPRQEQRKEATPAHWDLVYVDDDGTLLFTLVHVLSLNVDNHRLVGWCARTGTQKVFKLSKILKATDAQTGERVRLPSGAALRHADGHLGAHLGGHVSGHLSSHLSSHASSPSEGRAEAPAMIKTAAHRRIEARELQAAQASRSSRLRQRMRMA